MIVKLLDDLVAHDPSFIGNTEQVRFSRSKPSPGDVVVYTNTKLAHLYPQASAHIALMMESPEYHARFYRYIAKHNHQFDLVLTWDRTLLDRGENFHLTLHGTTWMHPHYRRLHSKSKACSLIASNKRLTSGHRLRHRLIDKIASQKLPVDLYGKRFRNLGSTGSNNPKSLDNGKIAALRDYMFSITIENCRADYYFTEKLIDCFLTGTIPVYWGCPSIGQFFDVEGVLSFKTERECLEIIPKLDQNYYLSLLPHVRENFERALKYTDFLINEKPILDILARKGLGSITADTSPEEKPVGSSQPAVPDNGQSLA
jgi:hypothetical protein